MTPRPLYRWKSFWFGALVIAFLGWGWKRSLGQLDLLTLQGPDVGITAVHDGGVLSLEVSRENGFPTPWSYSVWSEASPRDGSWVDGAFQPRPGSWFPAAIHPSYFEHEPGSGFGIAHWFVMLLYLVLWSGWLAWRWRRVKRLEAGLGRSGECRVPSDQ